MSIKHLVFSGGAIKGLSYIGCYKALEDLKLLGQLETCAGCSIGAVFATLVVLGYTGEELYDFILHFSYQDIRDLNFLRAFNNYGLETGEKITRFLGAMIKRKTGNSQITFLELFQKYPIKLVINATNLNTYKVKYFDYISSPDMPILLALRMSVSVPFLIKPVVYQKQFYVDGGLLDNLPVSQVPDCSESLAFDLEPVANLEINYNIQSLESYMYHVFGCVYTEINQYRMSAVKNIKVIKLDTQKVNSFSINLTQEQRIFLFNIGYETVLKTYAKTDTDLVAEFKVPELKVPELTVPESNKHSEEVPTSNTHSEEVPTSNTHSEEVSTSNTHSEEVPTSDTPSDVTTVLESEIHSEAPEDETNTDHWIEQD